MRGLIALLIVTSLVLAGAGCGSSKSSSSSAQTPAAQSQTTGGGTSFAKTRFALHAGLAFGAFHRYIYKPLKSGAFSGGLLHHKLATLKAAVAAVFVYHEVKLALADARGSSLLSKLLAPLLALQSRLSSLRSSLRSGHVDAGSIESANTAAGQVSSASAAAGQPVREVTTPALGG